MIRAYELMVIVDTDTDDEAIRGIITKIGSMISDGGGTVASTDEWGRRKYAYPINKKNEGFYVVFEITTEAPNLDDLDRYLRLADEVVRHKLMRLPDAEATRRGLLASADAAS